MKKAIFRGLIWAVKRTTKGKVRFQMIRAFLLTYAIIDLYGIRALWKGKFE